MYNDPDKELNKYNQQLKYEESLQKIPKVISVTNSLKKLEIAWGALFRCLFIIAAGFISYSYIDPEPIKDIPFSQLTLDLVAKKVFSIMIIIACIGWFFNFPKKESDHEENPCKTWAIWGYIVVAIGLIYFYVQ